MDRYTERLVKGRVGVDAFLMIAAGAILVIGGIIMIIVLSSFGLFLIAGGVFIIVQATHRFHIEYEYLGKYGDCVDLNTLTDTWYTYPDPEKCEFAVTKMALATEELYFAHKRSNE